MITFLINNYRHERQIAEERGKKLEELNNELQQLNASKDKLFSIIAHDLKSPFSSILGFSELSLEQLNAGDTKKTEQSIQMGISSVKKTLILVDNLLTWAKSQSGQIDFIPKKQNIQPIIEEVRKSLEPSAKLKNISVINFQSENLMVCVDKNMLQTILRNLISNAIKFTAMEGEVTIYTKTENSHVEITVEDNGVGMNPETINSLFTIETNKSTAGTAMEIGSGLGLILCKEFIEYHGGVIRAESESGKGSKFIFTIPKK
jgi:signal transduction histidine kinase